MFASSVEEYERNVRIYGCRDSVDLIVGDARDKLDIFGGSGFSIAFVDTDVYEVTKDILIKLSGLARGGEIVIVHDSGHLGIQKAVEDWKLACAYEVVSERIESKDQTMQYRLVQKYP